MSSRIDRIKRGLIQAKPYYPYFCASPVGLLKSGVHRKIAISAMVMRKVVKDSSSGAATDQIISDIASNSINFKLTSPLRDIHIQTSSTKEFIECQDIQSENNNMNRNPSTSSTKMISR